ncbi:hypothetical protein [Brachybacterium hainanense]|uniref:Uncharacterized protein n=1 Tax=Brachybacterium hainanense TaxID=1541174 RepID=A0ABV6RF39_9MICO
MRLGRQRLVHLLGADANALIFAHDAWSTRPDPAATVSWDA